MLRNYAIVALRNLRKHLGYSAINVVGLALGIACCLLIFLLIAHEWSHDAFHDNADRIHRVYIEEATTDGAAEPHLLTPPSLAASMDSAFGAIESVSRLITGTTYFSHDGNSFAESVILADPAFLRMFTFPLLAGDPATALDGLQSAVITQEIARKYFGVGPSDVDRVLGEELALVQGEDEYLFRVTGVAASIPNTSSLRFDIALSFSNYFLEPDGRLFLGGNDWGGKNSLYVLLGRDVDVKAFEAGLLPFTRAQLSDRIAARREAGFLAEEDDALRLRLQPLRDIHLSPEIGNFYEAAVHDPKYSYALGGIGLLVLFIACINFMTLAIGRSESRAREIGLRKTLGAHRRQIMKQFWGEALLLTAISIAGAMLLVYAALPEFNALTGKALSLGSMGGFALSAALLSILLLVAMVAGAYPAAVLSLYRPAEVLKGDVTARRSRLTRALVVVQYGISIGLIFSTLVIHRQTEFMLHKDLGFEDDQILVVHTPDLNGRQERHALAAMRAGTASNPNIQKVLKTGYAFTHSFDRYSWQEPDNRTIIAHMIGVDYGYVDALKMEIVAGRDFSSERPSDSTTAVLVNEAFTRQYGIEEPVGHRLSGFGGFFGDIDPTIIGVVGDFNFRSLHEAVEPAVLNMHPDYYHGMSHMLIKIGSQAIEQSIAQVEAIWQEAFPDKPFHFSFLDEDLAAQYHSEVRWSRILTYSSVLAILIACMGLFGLATLSVSRRNKEIGVRKVLGAGMGDVAVLVTRQFAILVGVAALFGWPLAYIGMHGWLDEFAYRISISWWTFAEAGLLVFTVALATVSYHAYRAAATDPVRSLRYE